MPISSLLRVCGIFSVIGGLLFLAMPVWYNVSLEVGAFADLIGMVLLVFGIIGIYLRQINASGLLGLITFIIVLIGTVLWTSFKWASAFIVPILEKLAPEILNTPPKILEIGMGISLFSFFIGWFLFALVTAWKGVLPRWGAILLILAMITEFIPFGYYVAQPLAGLGFIWLGYFLWKGKYEEVKLHQ
jgi:hypothetical protein